MTEINFQQIPTPTSGPRPLKFNEENRTVKLEWVAGESTDDVTGEPVTIVHQVSFSHQKSAKAYVARFYVVKESTQVVGENTWTTQSFDLFSADNFAVATQPVARYSKKSFEEFVDAVVNKIALTHVVDTAVDAVEAELAKLTGEEVTVDA